MTNTIAKAAGANAPAKDPREMGVNVYLSAVLDSEKMRKRFDELLGKRTPQFLSSLTSLINADANLQACLYESPMTVVQSALKAAMFDLPIDPALGYAYIVPFKNYKTGKREASMIIGYKGMVQMCLRTGAYSRVPDAVDVREGELIKYDRLTGDAEFRWEENDEVREKLPIVGYAGYFRLHNGAEKTIYMTCDQIRAHEQKHRKGREMSRGWREDFDSMARKTVLRRLIGKYGLMSIDYRNTSDAETVNLAQSLLSDNPPDEEYEVIQEPAEVDLATGEIIDS